MDKRWLTLVILCGILAGLGFILYQFVYLPIKPTFARSRRVVQWIRNPSAHPDWAVQAGGQCSPGAPFILPTSGLVGYLWDDSFKAFKHHQGIDIFSGSEVGKTQ